MPKGFSITLTQLANFSIRNSCPFAFYHLPFNRKIKIVAQKNSSVRQMKKGKGYTDKKGFVFAPFAENKKAFRVIIKPDLFLESNALNRMPAAKVLKSAKQSDSTSLRDSKSTGNEKAVYQTLVAKIKKKIAEEKFSKIVAARVIEKKKLKRFNPTTFFLDLCRKYPEAFVSLVYTPQFGLWIGASPEILLQYDGSGFKTYSLAGTKANTKANRKTSFGKKEIEEQKIVTEYIAESLQKASKAKPSVSKPEVVEAGNLLHLRTTFTLPDSSYTQWQKLAEKLHPTPAVAGIPKKKAIDFIQKNETGDRGFYSGYLGPVNLDGEINLYVNLRCMQVTDDKLKIHVGCGITAGSNADEEWKETELKAQTLLSVLG